MPDSNEVSEITMGPRRKEGEKTDILLLLPIGFLHSKHKPNGLFIYIYITITAILQTNKQNMRRNFNVTYQRCSNAKRSKSKQYKRGYKNVTVQTGIIFNRFQ